MSGAWPQTINGLRKHLDSCARPDFIQRCFLWINSWFDETFREIWKSQPETRKYFNRLVGVIDSMTPLERAKPELISFDRKDRIATGAGVDPSEVEHVLQMHFNMRDWRPPDDGK